MLAEVVTATNHLSNSKSLESLTPCQRCRLMGVTMCILGFTKSSLTFGTQSKLSRNSSRKFCYEIVPRETLLCAAKIAPLPCMQSLAGKAYAYVLSASFYGGWHIIFLTSDLASDQAGALFSLRVVCNGTQDKGQTFHICTLDLTKPRTQWTGRGPGRSCSAGVHPQSLLRSSGTFTCITQQLFAARLTLAPLAQMLISSTDACSTLVQQLF